MSFLGKRLLAKTNINSLGLKWEIGKTTSSDYIVFADNIFLENASGQNGKLRISYDGINWTEKNSNNFINGRLFLYSHFGRLLNINDTLSNNLLQYSDDLGDNWITVPTGFPTAPNGYFDSFAYGNGIFVGLANRNDSNATSNYAIYSYDGINWTMVSLPDGYGNWNSVIYAEGRFIALRSNNNYNATSTAYSLDGINWTSVMTPDDVAWGRLAYGNGTILSIAGLGNGVMYSTNSGQSWGYYEFPYGSGWSNLFYVNGLFITIKNMVGNSSDVAYSVDGLNWFKGNILPAPPISTWKGLISDGNIILAKGGIRAGDYNAYCRPFVFSNWTSTNLNLNKKWTDITHAKGKFVAISGTENDTTVAYSNNGITWSNTTIPSLSGINPKIAYGENKFIAIQNGSNLYAYSLDGITWTNGTLLQTHIRSITYGNDKFVVLTDARLSPNFLYSTDGINWSQTPGIGGIIWNSVTYGKGKFVAVGTAGNPNVPNPNLVCYSLDGITWTQGSAPATGNSFSNVIYNNGIFVAYQGEYSGTSAIYSYDGINWNSQIMPFTSSYTKVIYTQGLFLAFAQNTIYYSFNGINNWRFMTNLTTFANSPAGIAIGDGKIVILQNAGESSSLAYYSNFIYDSNLYYNDNSLDLFSLKINTALQS